MAPPQNEPPPTLPQDETLPPHLRLSRQATELAYQRHRAIHEAREWPRLADLFAEDATYQDPFFGLMAGREAIRAFLVKSMTGLEDWTFPIRWLVIDEGRVVTHWHNRLPGQRRDKTYFEFPGMSAISYDHQGLIRHQTDLYDRANALQVIAEGRSRTLELALTGVRWASRPLVRGAHWLAANTQRH